jgi:phage terminase large subunit-like protein
VTSRKRQKPAGPRPTDDHPADIARYIAGVLDGSIVVGRMVRRAVERHVRDLKRADKGWDYHFDEAAALRAIGFIQALKLSSGEFQGQPFILELWQKFIIWCVFGWKHVSDNLRRFREVFLTLGRGNGKTPLAAAIILLLAFFDHPTEPVAQVKIAATKRGQADLCFTECNQFIDQSPALRQRVERTKWSIVWKPNGSTIQPLGKEDTKSGDGFNLHAAVIDELHAWTDELKDLWAKIETALGKRRQPLRIVITTAGSDRSKLWLRVYKHSSQVLRRVFSDDAHFGFIAQIDEAEGDLPGDDPFDPNCWVKANPNLGISVNPDFLHRKAKKAKYDVTELHELKRYHLNVRVRAREKPIDLALWNACGEQPLPDLNRKPCYGGIDLGWRDDLASFYLVFPLDNGEYAMRGVSWICQESQRDLTAEPWFSWIRAGLLRVTPGDTTDPEAIYAEVKRAKRQYRLESVAIDRNNAMAVGVHIKNTLGVELYEFTQSTRKYNEPLRILLDLIKDRKLLHGGDGLLTWAADNLCIRSDSAGLWMPDKAASDEKIDPMVAMIMGLSEALYATKRPTGYTERGLRKFGRA